MNRSRGNYRRSSSSCTSLMVLLTAACCVTLAAPADPSTPTLLVCGEVGSVMNLSSIPTLSIDLPQLYQNEENTFTWTVNLCSPVFPAAGKVAACQDPFNLSHPDVPGYVIENRRTTCETTWTTVQTAAMLDGGGVQLTYGQRVDIDNHPGWTALVDVTCGERLELTPNAQVVTVGGTNIQTLQFYFTFTSSAVCGAASRNPFVCGGGCAFLGALVVGSVVYVIGVVLFQCVVEGKRGRAALPHPQFWATFAALVKEGMVYAWFTLTCRRRSRGNPYIVHRGVLDGRMGERGSAASSRGAHKEQTNAADYEELR